MLFSPAEQDMVSEKMRPIAAANNLDLISTNELFEYFVALVKERLHVVLCFSPVGVLLRKAIRKMPSVISCCSLTQVEEGPSACCQPVLQTEVGENELD